MLLVSNVINCPYVDGLSPTYGKIGVSYCFTDNISYEQIIVLVHNI